MSGAPGGAGTRLGPALGAGWVLGVLPPSTPQTPQAGFRVPTVVVTVLSPLQVVPGLLVGAGELPALPLFL